MMQSPKPSPSASAEVRRFGANGRGRGRPPSDWRPRSSRNESRHLPLADAGIEPRDLGEADRLLAALRRLPRHQRAALVLRFYAGYGTDEIAQVLGSSRATVRVHISRGRRRLRSLMEENEG
jgi:DNA-directed RNA polymerase specialized sigma24 family protein